MEPLTTSTRDKMILAALIVFGVLAFATIWVDRSLGAVMVGIIGSIVAGLFGIYKGLPSTPVPTSASSETQTTTTTSTDPPKGMVEEKGGS
jgi:uncharacterized YccA/Bax inhibitor family protein